MKNFMSLGIKQELQENLSRRGIKEPTPVQSESIPAILAGKDIIAQAQTGTGKTLAFLLPVVQNINTDKNYPQGLILTPTRELALQISKDARELTKDTDISILAAYGGQDVEKQIRQLKRGIHLIIATPGRLIDHLRRGSLSIKGIEYLVIDEADEMIMMGFGRDVEDIVGATTKNRQTMLFSATISGQVRDIGKRFMKKPVQIEIKSDNITLDKIEQIGIRIEEKDKDDRVMSLIDQYNPFLMLIFCRTREGVTRVYNKLKQNKYNVNELHGDLSQNKRERVMESFKTAEIQILVATDVAARGIDVEGITHVINYDLPNDSDSYIHRIGRTGRIGNEGIAITFVTDRDRRRLSEIEDKIKHKLKLIN